MAVNYIFFSNFDRKLWKKAFQPLWRRFWYYYLAQSADNELLEVVAPFIAWRCLVLANPVWYPDLAAKHRELLFEFVEATLGSEVFDPELAQHVFG